MSANLAVLELSALLRSGATNQDAIKAFQVDLLNEFQKSSFSSSGMYPVTPAAILLWP